MMRLVARYARSGGMHLTGVMLGLSPLFIIMPAAAQSYFPMPVKAAKITAPKVAGSCANTYFQDDNPDDNPEHLSGIRFDWAGACARVTGSIDNTYKNDLSVKITDGTNTTPVSTNTTTATASLDTSRRTSLGTLTTNTMVQWQKATDDHTHNGIATVQSLYASLAGVTAGYTSSLMDFWSGDFQFLATTPNVSIGIVSYEYALRENLKFALAVESGLPSPTQASEGLKGITTTSPDATARLRYYGDSGLTLHFSGLVRNAEFSATPFSPTFSQTGWAASMGASTPITLTGKDDSVSMQFDYAVNAAQTLGTVADVKQVEKYGAVGPTRGWSIVASLNHPWTKELESNAFVSYISVDVDAAIAKPSARSTRLAANLYWRPFRHFRIGAEIGWVHAEINADGIQGLPFSKLDGVAGYLNARLDF